MVEIYEGHLGPHPGGLQSRATEPPMGRGRAGNSSRCEARRTSRCAPPLKKTCETHVLACTAPEARSGMLHSSEHEPYRLTTLDSVVLIAMRAGGRFPGLSPNYPTLVPTGHRAQDPGSIPRAFVSAPPPQLTSRRSPGQVPRGGREGETRPGSASNSPGDLDEVTALSRPVSYCA